MVSVQNPNGTDYEDNDDDEEDKSYYDPSLVGDFNDILHKYPDTELSHHFYVLTLVPMICVLLLTVVLLIVAFLYRKSKKKYMYATGRSVMTFSNPNYYTSGNEQSGPAPSTDKKSFLWKRLKYDKSQVRRED